MKCKVTKKEYKALQDVVFFASGGEAVSRKKRNESIKLAHKVVSRIKDCK